MRTGIILSLALLPVAVCSPIREQASAQTTERAVVVPRHDSAWSPEEPELSRFVAQELAVAANRCAREHTRGNFQVLRCQYVRAVQRDGEPLYWGVLVRATTQVDGDADLTRAMVISASVNLCMQQMVSAWARNREERWREATNAPMIAVIGARECESVLELSLRSERVTSLEPRGTDRDQMELTRESNGDLSVFVIRTGGWRSPVETYRIPMGAELRAGQKVTVMIEYRARGRVLRIDPYEYSRPTSE